MTIGTWRELTAMHNELMAGLEPDPKDRTERLYKLKFIEDQIDEAEGSGKLAAVLDRFTLSDGPVIKLCDEVIWRLSRRLHLRFDEVRAIDLDQAAEVLDRPKLVSEALSHE